MNTKNQITGIVLFLSMLACAIPGLSQPAAPANFDPASLSTMVVMTADALASQTAAAVPPTPFEMPTLIPTPAFTETVTASPRISSLGTSLLKRDDQTTLFTDRRAGIELIIPAGWLAFRLNEQEYYDAFLLPELSDPSFQRSLNNIKNFNANEFRMVALDIQDGHLQDGFVTNINLYWAETATISLDNDSDLQEIANSDAKASPNLDILATDVSVTSSGIPIGVITSKMPGTTVEGVKFVVYYKQFYLKAYTGVLTITLTTTEELKDVVIPGFDAIIETIKTGVE